MEAASRAYLARVLFAQGRRALAFTEIHAALALARTARQILPFILASLADMELAAGSHEAAAQHANEALELQRRTGSDGAHETYLLVTLARALAAVGRADEADATFAAAYARFDARLAKIRDPKLRADFERVEENAAVLARVSSGPPRRP